METYFADTFYYRALFDLRDEHHDRVVEWTKRRRYRTVTTDFILIELGDEFRKQPHRGAFLVVLADLVNDPLVEIVEASTNWVEEGITHFRSYADKEWGMTDCISFVVMARRGLTKALTGDRHFVQAGYQALLREEHP